MKRAVTFLIVVVLATGIALSRAAEPTPQAKAWVTLFGGSSIAAFNPIGNANWQVAEGVVQATTGTGFLVTKESYTDFELKVEFWVDDDANSGVFLRCSNPAEIDSNNAYEVNIFDKRPDQNGRTGSIVDVAKPLATLNTGGKWNTFEIIAKGPRMTVTLNGTKTAEADSTAHPKGPIALQHAAGTVKFRNVQIRAL